MTIIKNRIFTYRTFITIASGVASFITNFTNALSTNTFPVTGTYFSTA